MDYNPYTSGYNFSDLLQSQTGFGSSEAPGFGTQQNPDCNLETSQATESKTSECDEGNTRPLGVKAAKARGKKPQGKDVEDYQKMWNIRQQDVANKEKLYNMSLLDNLVAKKRHCLRPRKL
ncbi:hypothetical protein F2Q69_00007709 [Brassica cretica]|uniref:No apical meristem-associated C-terminal domain-containing protein n=1 Tax=Brassica cretica TaxID=69181 RepID=A0A8S9NQA6_BRACR|nr:hypothetical protein F2Q69_00007709 [Brassica cretica]